MNEPKINQGSLSRAKKGLYRQKIVWTALPWGRVTEGEFAGRLRVSLVVSPRLTPVQAAEQLLGAPAYRDFHDWPQALESLPLFLEMEGTPNPIPLEIISKPSSERWHQFFSDKTPVAGFRFTDMSKVNLRSYSVRNVLSFVHEHYTQLASSSGGAHPKLLPWIGADPALKNMLTDAGTVTEPISLGRRDFERMRPGFDRFFDEPDTSGKPSDGLDWRLRTWVFNAKSNYQAPLPAFDGKESGATFPIRVLPADWVDPTLGGPDKALMGQFNSANEYTLFQANRFYKRTQPTKAQLAMRRPELKNIQPPIKIDDFDFHRIIASLADYPALLRELGLVIDCVLPKDNPISAALENQTTAEGQIGVLIKRDSAPVDDPDAYPRTAYRATAARFVVRERTSDHANGLLHLGGTQDPALVRPPFAKPGSLAPGNFDVFQVDPDGAALKTVNFVLTAQNLVARSLSLGSHGKVTYSTGDTQPVAALRSGGLGVSRHGRAAQVATDAALAASMNAQFADAATSRKVVLFTEDVLRGYRVDVENQGKWRSLCWRQGQYRLVASNQMLEFGADEGYVKGASTTGDGSDDHYLHEALFRWTGWSLAVPRPGRKISKVTDDKSGLQGEAVSDKEEAADNGNGLAVRFTIPATPRSKLPRLRFGEDYRMRARVVDLAGNSLDGDGIRDHLEQATEAVSYLRFEPVDPPALVHKHRVSEGESLERMVIRSNYNLDPKAYLESKPFSDEIKSAASKDFEYVAGNERHVVPPKSSQLQCEQHGLFDTAFAGGTPEAIKAAYETASREAGTLFDPLPSAKVEIVTPDSVVAEARTTETPPALPSFESPTGGQLVGGQYVIHRETLIETPYLPDGAAGGIAIRGDTRADMARIGILHAISEAELGKGARVEIAPGTEELVLRVDYGEKWPKSQGMRIVLHERAHTLEDGHCTEQFPDEGRPKWDPETRTLMLFLRKGHIARLRYSSFITKETIDEFGLPRWIPSATQAEPISTMATLGAHWMLTPFRSLVLVHATQQPVCTPLLRRIVPDRDRGTTFADLDAQVTLHGPSTGKFEVVAEWDEWIDDLSRPGPELVHMRAQLAEIPLAENHENEFSLADAANATQVPPANVAYPSATQRLKGNRHDFGDTKFRLVRYCIEATTRFREYLPPSLYAQRDQITRLGPIAYESYALLGTDKDPGAAVSFGVTNSQPNGTPIPASHAPDVPRVVYVVPTFRWLQGTNQVGQPQSSTRLGNGLRVYLERPWFSSGDGELLGVVLAGDGQEFTTISEKMQPYVTQWGIDPLFDSAVTKSKIGAADFTSRIRSEYVLLQEYPDAMVHVVGHRVQWDAERHLWFADIELNPGNSYMPFVRLALVRYQPYALASEKISAVTLAEFAQVLPRRESVLQRLDRRQVSVKIYGPYANHGSMQIGNDSAYLPQDLPQPMMQIATALLETGRNSIELVLQTRDPAIDSDLAWSDVAKLATGLAVSSGSGMTFVPIGGNLQAGASIFEQPAISAATTLKRASGLGDVQNFGDTVALGATASNVGAAAESLANIPIRREDPIWEATATLPAFSGPARLVVREFERYYTDRTVPERVAGVVRQRRVIEERLVYSEFFPID